MTSSLPATADIVIVGAGLAGLAAARELQQRDLSVVIVEAADRVGGRVTSDDVAGIPFALDRGFQVYNPAYPEGQRVLDHAALDLQSFAAGVLVRIGDRLWRVGDPRRVPTWSLSGLRAPIGSPMTKTRLANYARTVAWGKVDELEQAADVSTATALNEAGLSGPLLDRILQPFLSGVFLEPDLTTSRRFGDLVLRSFVRGTPAVPADGMRAIPQQLAGALTNASIVLDTRAEQLTSTGVQTTAGHIAAAHVIVAADPVTATALLDLPTPAMNSGTTCYFLADELGQGVGAITIDGDNGGPVVNAYVLNNVIRPHQHRDASAVVAASVIGWHDDTDTEHAVRQHLGSLYGADTSSWQSVAHYPIAHALPSMTPPFEVRKPVRLAAGRYVAGDHRDTSSIQGALVSGRRAARALLKDLQLLP